MNKLITSIMIMSCAFMLMLTGCKTSPSTETLYTTTYAIGVSSALVMDQTKIPDQTRNTIIEIMNEIDSSVPQTNTTFEVAWTPIAERHTQKLIDDKKIDEDQAKLILSGFGTAVKTLDYFVFKRYPQVGANVELVEAATHGFCTGFLTYYKPINIVSASSDVPLYDDEAYSYMMNLSKKNGLIK